MDVSRIRNKSIMAWIDIEDGISVLCRFVSQTKWEEIRAEATETILEPEAVEPKEKFDEVKFRHLYGRFAVVDVRGLTDGVDDQKQPLPFLVTPENIDMLMDDWAEFRLVVLGSTLRLSKMFQAYLDDSKKNSLPIPEPLPTSPASTVPIVSSQRKETALPGLVKRLKDAGFRLFRKQEKG